MSKSGNTRIYPLILVLAVFLTFAGGWASKAEGSNLTDLGEAEWARQAITEMEASGVVAGYPGGVYLPYNNVTKLEAVTMLIRMLGLESEAREAEETGADYEMPPDLYWGSGYLIMAVEKGMLDEDYLYLLQSNEPATRTEVAMLAFHALQLAPESGALEFDDSDQIPGDFRDGVAAVVKSGIMQGYPGNVFKPNDNINRAQIAVLMSNIVDLEYTDPCPDRRADGTVLSVSHGSRVITVEPAGSIFYTAGCEVFLDGSSILPDGLKAGDEVEIILDEYRQAVYIDAQRPADSQEYEDSAEDNNSQASYSSLEGEIRDLDTIGTLGIAIRDVDRKTTEYKVIDDVEVERDGDSIDFDELDEGEWVRLELNKRDYVKFIEVIEEYSAAEVTVNNLVIDNSPKKIRIMKSNGTRAQYDISRNADYYRGSKSITLEDIMIGAKVKVRVNDRDQVIRIDVVNDEDITLEGEVIYVSRGDNKIRIEQVSGNRFTFKFADSPVLKEKDGEILKLRDIKEDSEVSIKLKSGKVTSLTVLD